MPAPIKDIPQDKVGEVVQDFIDLDNIKELHVKRQPDGKFTVTPVA